MHCFKQKNRRKITGLANWELHLLFMFTCQECTYTDCAKANNHRLECNGRAERY